MASLPQFERKGIHARAAQPPNPETVSGLNRHDYPVGPAHEMKRYRTLVSRAVDAFGDEVKASRWLSLPNRDLDGQTPLQVAQKDGYSLKAIEPLLTRIEHGVYY